MTSEQSLRTKKAFAHLNSIKPYDGWSIDMYVNSFNKTLVMLKRRNVPLSDRGFVELALEKDTQCVVGIVSHIGDADNCAYARGVALVEKNGKILHGVKEKRFTIDQNPTPSDNEHKREKKELNLKEVRAEMRQNQESARNSIKKREKKNEIDIMSSSNGQSSVTNGLTDDQNKQLIKLAMMTIGAATAFRILSSLLFPAFMLALSFPLLYSTCPNQDTFDAKKELKRVLRGKYEPQTQQDKPQNWFSETVTRIQASVTAEVATGLGHEISFLDVFGACTFVTVHVPSMRLKLYFIGIFNEWRYILHMNSEPSAEG